MLQLVHGMKYLRGAQICVNYLCGAQIFEKYMCGARIFSIIVKRCLGQVRLVAGLEEAPERERRLRHHSLEYGSAGPEREVPTGKSSIFHKLFSIFDIFA